MKVKLLGTAAGGGFPQWNCACANCAGIRAGTVAARRRTQSSIAVSADGVDWLLVNASPDIHSQIEQNRELWPAEGRGTPIRWIALTDSQLDHTAGLLLLREGSSLNVISTQGILDDLRTGFPALTILDRCCGTETLAVAADRNWRTIPGLPGLEVAFHPIHTVKSRYLRNPGEVARFQGAAVAICFRDHGCGKSIVYAPALSEFDSELDQWFADAAVIFCDGTFWTDDEMQRVAGINKSASAMGHMPIFDDRMAADGRPTSLFQWLARHKHARKVLIHINNTNPILRWDSQEREMLAGQNVEVGADRDLIEV
jgi:pyrroloquinoline quinone biosynthesis protein B